MSARGNLNENSAAFDQELARPDLADQSTEVESLIEKITFEGKLHALIACACEKSLMYHQADPGFEPNPGVLAAINAFAAWKQSEGRIMATDITQNEGITKPRAGQPETLPLALAGKWVAWSSDGLRIVAFSESSQEAVSLAMAAGEPEPILERHPGRYRL